MTLDPKDFKALGDIVKTTIDEDETLVRKADISHLPTKTDFYDKMDEVMGELKTIRENTSVLSHQMSDHEERITDLEEKVAIAAS